MSCVHPSLAEGIGIEAFIAMGRVAEHLPPALARHHSTISSTLRQGSAKSGCHARTADHRARKRGKMPRHDRCMSRSDLVARVDEPLHSDWPPEQSAGRMRPGSAAATRTRVASCDSTSQGAAACAKAREALLKADHRLHTRPRK